VTPRHHLRRQGGSGALVMVALVPAVVAVLVVTLEAGAVVAAGAAAAGTADLAALAAAGALADARSGDGAGAHAAARQVAAANRAELVACRCDDVPVEVTVTVRVDSPFGLVDDRTVTGSARATLVPRS
jgi:secretion/DNA translocation related TadE-like protein